MKPFSLVCPRFQLSERTPAHANSLDEESRGNKDRIADHHGICDLVAVFTIKRHIQFMGRIEELYKKRFRAMLAASGSAQPDAEAKEIIAAAAQQSSVRLTSLSFALARIHADLSRERGLTAHSPHTFMCDAGLGGLARWLRGAGYESYWNAKLDDAAVIREARQRHATLITTDSLMMERGVLRDGIVPSVFVPSTLTCEQQLEIVFRELGLSQREPRCMSCGGELRRVEKQTVAKRIPPKTARWLDEYFVCANCNRLFWRGTHWQRIQRRIRNASRGTEGMTLNQD